MTVCVCVDVRLILVLELGRQIVYGQNTVYLCLTRYMCFDLNHAHDAITARAAATGPVSMPTRLVCLHPLWGASKGIGRGKGNGRWKNVADKAGTRWQTG